MRLIWFSINVKRENSSSSLRTRKTSSALFFSLSHSPAHTFTSLMLVFHPSFFFLKRKERKLDGKFTFLTERSHFFDWPLSVNMIKVMHQFSRSCEPICQKLCVNSTKSVCLVPLESFRAESCWEYLVQTSHLFCFCLFISRNQEVGAKNT